jgi:acyl-CoA synthetase (NDP forming)
MHTDRFVLNDDAAREGRSALLETEGIELLRSIGIPVPAHIFVPAVEDLDAVMLDRIGSDHVVVKVVSPDILHKSEVGGVKIVPRSLDLVQATMTTMSSALQRYDIRGFLILQRVEYDRSPGGELLVGLRWTDDFGPVLTFGPGGIYTEFLSKQFQDSVGIVSAANAGPETAAAALARSAVTTMVDGSLRNQKPRVDLDELRSILEALLEFAGNAMPSPVREMEINPLVAGPNGLVALDVLVKLGEALPPPRPPVPLEKVGHLLQPASIGIIGVSSKLNPGRIILNNILREKFESSRIWIVKPGTTTIEGCACVPDIESLPEPVDLFILAVSAEQTPGVLEELIRTRKAESIIVIPGGLEEREGSEETVRRMQTALFESRNTDWKGPVINGGNCLGIRSRPGHYDTLFIPEHKLPEPGTDVAPLAMISQSGAFAVAQASKLGKINPKYLASIGNQTDLTAGDYLTYLKNDPEIRLFACYVEGFKPLDGLKWLTAAREITQSGRTVLLYRAGRTTAGAEASASHTASIAGDYEVTRQLAEQAGVIVAESLADFDDLIRLFTHLRPLQQTGGGSLGRIGAVSNAGFECVAIADSLGPFGLAEFETSTCDTLNLFFRKCRIDGIVTARNPLDLTPILPDDLYEQAVRAVLQDRNVDLGLIGCVPLTGALQTLPAGSGYTEDILDYDSIVARLGRLKKETEKPWVAVVDAGKMYDPMVSALNDNCIPTFRTADRALRLLAVWGGKCGAD